MLLDTLVAQAESIGVEFGCTMDLHFYSMADQHSNIMDAPPPLGPIFFISMQFSAKFGQTMKFFLNGAEVSLNSVNSRESGRSPKPELDSI